MTLKKSLLRTLIQLSILTTALTIALSLNYLYASPYAWTGPTGTAPANNVGAPINITNATQVKDGNVSVGLGTNSTAVGLNPLGLTIAGSQRVEGWLKVGDGATGNPTQLLDLTGTAGVDGIKFPDGTEQTTAATGGGGGGGIVLESGYLSNSTKTISSAQATYIALVGYSNQTSDASVGGGFITKEGGVWKANLEVSPTNSSFTLTTVEQCVASTLCTSLTATGDVVLRATASVKIQYMVFGGGVSEITTSLALSFAKYMHVQQTISVVSVIGAGWTTRTLNADVTNSISGASRSGNQIILPAGTYYIDGDAMAFSINWGKNALYNVTDGAYTHTGISMKANGGSEDQGGGNSRVAGQFTIPSTKTFEFRTYASEGGDCSPFGTGTNVCVDVKIWKLD